MTGSTPASLSPTPRPREARRARAAPHCATLARRSSGPLGPPPGVPECQPYEHLGIDAGTALTALHVRTERGEVAAGCDALPIIGASLPILNPVSGVLSLSPIRSNRPPGRISGPQSGRTCPVARRLRFRATTCLLDSLGQRLHVAVNVFILQRDGVDHLPEVGYALVRQRVLAYQLAAEHRSGALRRDCRVHCGGALTREPAGKRHVVCVQVVSPRTQDDVDPRLVLWVSVACSEIDCPRIAIAPDEPANVGVSPSARTTLQLADVAIAEDERCQGAGKSPNPGAWIWIWGRSSSPPRGPSG